MKILTLVWSIGIGGTERAAVNYAIGYKLYGNESKVLVLGEGHERYNDLVNAKVETTLLIKSPAAPDRIFNELKEWEPNIIHVHNFGDAILEYINLIKGDNTRVVETNVFSRPNFSSSYKAISLSMQLSAWGYLKYIKRMKKAEYCPTAAIVPYIVDGSKFIVPHENDIKSFLNLHDIPGDAFVVGRLGQAHPSKWDTRLLKIINRTIRRENNIFYLLVGLPDNLCSLFSKQSDFFQSRVKQIDKIEGDVNLSLYYHSLNCFAHISKIGESFGYVLAEALLCKTPVITMLTPFKDNAQFEVVGHEYGGFCVTNVDEFVEAIFNLYSKKKLAISIKENLSNWIESRFSYDVIVPKQIELYTLLLEKKSIEIPDVSTTIDNSIKLYRCRKWIIKIVFSLTNNPTLYNLSAHLKKLATSVRK